MAFKWCCKCVSPETEDVRELNYQQMMLLDVPAEVFVYERTLEELYLDSNKIRDLPRPLFHCHGLKILSMSENDVRSLPPAIASLINLQNVDFSKNDLRGIPDNIKGCKHLTHINVAANPLEKLPEGFTQLLCLEEVYLNDTLLEFLPANFGRLTKLRILELRANNLNTLPKSIARLSNLERLDIGQNDFSTLPEVIGSLTNLRELWIDGNTISSIPSFIGHLKKLHNLDASHNRINSIAEDIGECKELSDLLLSDNELVELPHVLGEFKELTTLRCDENQLKCLPKTIGQLTNLEELVLNQNDIEDLPPQIGLLRKLHMLNLDDNLLEELPPEIGSCSGLTILSVRGNRLQEIPAEVGHLPQIRVLNLAENFLKNLPVSVLNLTQLTALWLSNNQSTPLTTLQQEVDSRTGQTVCINFMLPQPLKESVYRDRHAASSPKPDQLAIDRSSTTKLREHQHIRFATDTDSEEPHSLLRAPTPYPKELRNMSKRQQKKLQKKQSDEEVPLLGEMVSPGEKDRLIKEAKVKKPSTISVSNTAVSDVESEVRDCENVAVDISSGVGEYIRVPNHPPVCDEYVSPLQKSEPSEAQESSEDGSPVLASGSGPVIRKAKYIRRGLCSPSEAVVETNQQEQNHLQEAEPHAQPQQPPPYHIAAAYSKQAAHFLTRFEERINQLTLDTSLSSTELQTSHKEKDSDDNESVSYIIFSDQDNSLKHFNNVNECFEITDTISDLSTSEMTATDIKVAEMIADTKEANGNSSCEVNSYKDVAMDEESIKTKEAISTLTSLKENPTSDLSDIQYVEEDTTAIPKCKVPVKQDNMSVRPEHFHEENVNKPWTFIQDKPVVSDLIVAPTPQRPGSTPSSLTSPVVSPKPVRPSSTSPSRIGSKIPAPLPSYSSVIARPETKCINGTSWPAPPPDIISTSSLDNSAVRLSPSKFSTNSPPIESDSWSHTSPITTRIPQPGFYSSVHHNYHYSSKRSSISSHSSSNSRPGSIAPPQNTWDIEAGHNYQNLPHTFMTTDHNLNISTKKSSSPLTTSLKASANGIESSSSTMEIGSVRSPLTSKIPLLMSSGSSPHTRKISSSSSPGEKADLSMKHTKAWMFGPHKNATVFPVVIHKNPGLGFSITGGMSSPRLADKKENGIFISKIHPNGPASSHLLPGDKILEVDGIDFTKVDHDQAVGILKQTGSVVNMMISRNQ